MTGLSIAVAETLTRWATFFDGGCTHGGQQYARPGHVRSGCQSCAAAFDGWDQAGGCDLCGRVCQPHGAWTLPVEMTGGVAVLMRICDTCAVHQLTDFDFNNEEDEMTMITTMAAGSCGDCVQTFAQGVTRGRQGHDFSRLHPECRQALRTGLAGYGRRSTGGDIVTRIRVVLATRALGGAA